MFYLDRSRNLDPSKTDKSLSSPLDRFPPLKIKTFERDIHLWSELGLFPPFPNRESYHTLTSRITPPLFPLSTFSAVRLHGDKSSRFRKIYRPRVIEITLSLLSE